MACICHSLLHICPEFQQHLCMTFQSFQKLVRLLLNGPLINQEMASLHGGAIIPELCVYINLQYLAGRSYMDIFSLLVFCELFPIYYRTQLRQLTIVQSYRLLGPIPRNGKLNVLVDLHSLAQIMPCLNVLLFWMDTISRQ